LAPGALLHHLDKELERYTKEWRMNCALCYVEITPPNCKEVKGLIRIANSGLIPPFLKRLTGETEMTKVGGGPLGAGFGDLTDYPELKLEIAPGDLLIITSDGAPEAKNLAGVMFGFERLEKVIAQGPITSAQAMLDHLKVNLATFVGAAEPHDDTTIVVIQMGCQASIEKQLQALEIEASYGLI
jgi:serine phosphatase RsbU (regulator of sigma subunit)